MPVLRQYWEPNCNTGPLKNRVLVSWWQLSTVLDLNLSHQYCASILPRFYSKLCHLCLPFVTVFAVPVSSQYYPQIPRKIVYFTLWTNNVPLLHRDSNLYHVTLACKLLQSVLKKYQVSTLRIPGIMPWVRLKCIAIGTTLMLCQYTTMIYHKACGPGTPFVTISTGPILWQFSTQTQLSAIWA